MKFFNINTLKNRLYRLNSFQIFVLFFFICLSFYLFEGLIGIDRFYHPDSTFYLTKIRLWSFKAFLNNPTLWFHQGYLIVSKYLFNNYYLLILLNFILYSLTNLLIFNQIFKKYFKSLNNFKLFVLFYLLFLDPYRLHLASHILKETILIFIITVIILSNKKLIKLFFIFLLEIFRSKSWIYLFIFLTYSKIKKIIKNKIFYISVFLFLLLIIIISLFSQNMQDIIQNIFNFTINILKEYDNKEMPIRSYDHVNQFKNYEFPLGFILKNITWPIMQVSGLFIFFVSSILFKFLGAIIIINNFLIYMLTKNTHISLGLLIILLSISVYTTSYTAMFRYSYVAIYMSIIYFFFQIDEKSFQEIKK